MLKKFVVFAVLMCCASAHAGVVINPRVCVTADEPVLDTCTTPLDDNYPKACNEAPTEYGSTLCNTAYPDKCVWIPTGDRTHGIKHLGPQSAINPPETQVVQQGSYEAVVLESHVCAEYWKCSCIDHGMGIGFCGTIIGDKISEWILNTYDLDNTTECIINGGGGGQPPE
jgi:hypothetical protein